MKENKERKEGRKISGMYLGIYVYSTFFLISPIYSTRDSNIHP